MKVCIEREKNYDGTLLVRLAYKCPLSFFYLELEKPLAAPAADPGPSLVTAAAADITGILNLPLARTLGVSRQGSAHTLSRRKYQFSLSHTQYAGGREPNM